MSERNVEILARNSCQLGEGPHWSEAEQCLYYIDIFGKKVCRYDPATNENKSLQVAQFFQPTDIFLPRAVFTYLSTRHHCSSELAPPFYSFFLGALMTNKFRI